MIEQFKRIEEQMEGLPRTQSLPPRIKGKNSYVSTNWVEIDDCGTEVSNRDAKRSRHLTHEERDRADGRALSRTRRLPPRTKGKNNYVSILRNLSATNWVDIEAAEQQFVHSKASNGYITANSDLLGSTNQEKPE